MEKFEYKVVTYDPNGFFCGNVQVNKIESQLNLLGDDGWEMVIDMQKGLVDPMVGI